MGIRCEILFACGRVEKLLKSCLLYLSKGNVRFVLTLYFAISVITGGYIDLYHIS